MVTELKRGVYWVGVVDWSLKHFHGYELSTHRGSTYNAYLLVDDKIALVDTVWGPFAEQLMANIAEIVEPARIDYVIANHSEIDHAGALPVVMRHAPNATVVVSKRGLDSVPGHFHQAWKFQAVHTGDSISLGKNNLVFVEAPMLHWPDSMFTYLTGLNILMPNDAFGQHYATAFRYNDQVDQTELYEEALKYYANILTPFSARVTAKIEEVLKLNLPVDIIAPSHGVIWRDNPLQIVNQYAQWAKQEPEKRAAIIYDTMWEGTRHLAEAIGAGLASEGVPFAALYVPVSDRNDIITQVFRSRAVIVGSPTINRGYLSTLAPVMEDLRGLEFKNKVGAAFGCYGWSGEAVKIIEEQLKQYGIEVVAPAFKAKWQPNTEDLARCREMGVQIARAM
ncbi:MAG: flavodoxin domain-containing protein [Chloroflexi bacterium]|nr:flavodoxin domain-containing protein [Chloroflexota bacterium]